MNSLRDGTLSVLENWDTFRPSMKGYLPPAALTLDCGNVEAQINEYADPHYTNRGKAIPGLRDAFRVWRHGLTSGAPDMPPAIAIMTLMFPRKLCVSELEDCDENRLLRHLAPVAKAYEFRLCFGHVLHIMSCEHKVQHEYKEYYDWYEELDEDDMEMSDKNRVECEWTFRDLGWGETDVTVADLGEALEARVVEAAEDEDVDETDMKCVDDGIYEGTVRLTHTRHYTFLVVLPA